MGPGLGIPGTLPARSLQIPYSSQDGMPAVFFAEAGKYWYMACDVPANGRQLTGRTVRIFFGWCGVLDGLVSWGVPAQRGF